MAVGDRHRLGIDRLRVATWRGDDHVALLTPLPDLPAPNAHAILQQVDALRADGIHRVVTSALGRREQAGFLAAGFQVHERLHLLSRDLRSIPEAMSSHRLRRARRADEPSVLDVDHRAFQPFWRLDLRGLHDAVDATPSSRFRVSVEEGITGYAIWGRAAERGYLQRLAVDPAHHRQGIGTALVADGLRWLRRRGARRVAVNTQEGNVSALAAYEALGFAPEPEGLTVLSLDLTSEAW